MTLLDSAHVCSRALRVLGSMTQEANGQAPRLDEKSDAEYVLSVVIKDLREKNSSLTEGVESDSSTVTYYALPNGKIPYFTSFRKESPKPYAPDTTPKKGAIGLAHPEIPASRVWARSSSPAETLAKLLSVQADLAPASQRPTFATVLRGADAQRFISKLISASPYETKEVSTAPSSDPRDRYGLWQATTVLAPLRERAKWLFPFPMAVLAMPHVESANMRGALFVGSLAFTGLHMAWNAHRESIKTKYLENPDGDGVKTFAPSPKTSHRYPSLLPEDQLGSVLFHAANKPRHLDGWRQKFWQHLLPEFKKRNHGDWVVYSKRDAETGVDFTLLYEFGSDDRVVIVARGDKANPRTLVEQLGVRLDDLDGESAVPGETEFFRSGVRP